MKKRNLSASELQEMMTYNPESGEFTWVAMPRYMFSRDGDWLNWHTRYAGMRALYTRDTHGYLRGYIFGNKVYAHRAAWALMTGEWPTKQIDHINGDRADNRFANLRHVTGRENTRNAKRYANNTSGANGVHWYKSRKRWTAHITVDGRTRHLGYFTRFEDAVAARKFAEVKHDFTETHGLTEAERIWMAAEPVATASEASVPPRRAA